VEGEIGLFNISIKNFGISDVKNVEIFDDYFVARTPKDGPTTLYRIGVVSTMASINIPSINSNESKEFTLDFRNISKQLSDFYISPEVKGQRMKIVRLLINFERAVDDKKFEYKKAYIIAGHGDFLLDHSNRGISSPHPIYLEITSL